MVPRLLYEIDKSIAIRFVLILERRLFISKVIY